MIDDSRGCAIFRVRFESVVEKDVGLVVIAMRIDNLMRQKYSRESRAITNNWNHPTLLLQ
jgi:hypothetical protein